MNTKGRIHYGWWIVGGGFLLNFCGIGIVINCTSIYFKPVIDNFGFSRGDLALYFTIAAVSMMVAAPFVGKLLEKFDVRLVMGISTAAMSTCIMLFSRCSTLPQFYTAAFFMGIGSAGAHIIPVSMMVNNWFREKQGLAMGIVFAASALGGAIGSTATDWAILKYGWQASYAITGFLVGLVTVPISVFVMRTRPEDMGLRPYGEPAEGVESADNSGCMTVIDYLKTGSFWLLAASFFLISIVCLGIQQHIVPYLIDLGYRSALAAQILALSMVVLVPAKIALGAVCDRIGLRRSYIVILVILIMADLSLFGMRAFWMVIGFAVLFGFANGVPTVMFPLMTSAYLGSRRFAVMFGVLNIFITLGSGIGMPLSGYIFDMTGNYDPAWWLYAGLTVLSGITGTIALRRGNGRRGASRVAGQPLQ